MSNQLPTWMARLLRRAQRDGAAFNDAPGFVFGGAQRTMIDDGNYGDPLEGRDNVYIDEDGQVWHSMGLSQRSEKH